MLTYLRELRRETKVLLTIGIVFFSLVLGYDMYYHVQLRVSSYPPYEPPDRSQQAYPRHSEVYFRYAPGGDWNRSLSLNFYNWRKELAIKIWVCDSKIIDYRRKP